MNKAYLFLFLLLMLILHSKAQNLFDATHSFQYGFYLFDNKQYTLASDEFERALFLSPQNDSIRLMLMKSNLLAGNCHRNSEIYHRFPPTIPAIASENAKSLLLCADYQQVESFLLEYNFENSEAENYRQMLFLLSQRFDAAIERQALFAPSSQIWQITEAAANIRYKKPLVAAGLSAIVPGLGKVYTRNANDGIYALLFVATNAWQAYRGFSKKGLQSGYGWVFGTLTVGFYAGNIAGAYRSAKRYNKQKNEDIFYRTQALLLVAD